MSKPTPFTSCMNGSALVNNASGSEKTLEMIIPSRITCTITAWRRSSGSATALFSSQRVRRSFMRDYPCGGPHTGPSFAPV
jgi:hypothetical protein